MGNIRIHDRKRGRYRCMTCRQTFSARRGTMLEGLRKPTELIVVVITLLAYGCPIQAIVHAYGLDERTVADWCDRAGRQCQKLHQALVEQANLDLVHVQADEICVKGRSLLAWMGLAMTVSTRLWLAGVVSLHRDTSLADQLLAQVRRCCQACRPLLVCTDGWAAYQGSIIRAFRQKVKRTPGRGRSALVVWPELLIATIIKHTHKKRVFEVTRWMTRGTQQQAKVLLEQSRGGSVLNTAFIERLNATFRERLATLTRRCRHTAHRVEALETGMYLIGCAYNFCVVHDELSSSRHFGSSTTPAMAAGLTDRVWNMQEMFRFKVAPAPWITPKQRGRPRKAQRRAKSPSVRSPRQQPLLRLLNVSKTLVGES
jgi:IS1 family transposase